MGLDGNIITIVNLPVEYALFKTREYIFKRRFGGYFRVLVSRILVRMNSWLESLEHACHVGLGL